MSTRSQGLRLGRSVACLFMIANLLLTVGSLVGCSSGTHKITEGESCLVCHGSAKEEHAAVDVPDAKASSLNLKLVTSAKEVYLCKARFGGDNGEKLIPTLFRTVYPEEYDSVALPSPGLYLLCTGSMDNPNITPIVAEEGEEVTEVVL